MTRPAPPPARPDGAASGGTLRPLSGLERAWLIGGRIAPPFAIHMVVEAPAPLDVDRWITAIDGAGAAWPGLRARLTGALRGTRWIAEDRPLPIEIGSTPWRGDRPDPRLEAPLIPGPGARALLLPDDGRVVFSAHHALTDGRGLFGFVEDVARALAGEPVRGAVGGPLIDAELARGLTDVTPFEPPSPTAAPPFPGEPAAVSGLTWRRRRLPAGSNVVPRLVAAVRQMAGEPQTIGVPVDLRRHMPDLRSSANLTGVAHLDVPAPDATAIRAALDRALAARAAAGHALHAEMVRGLPLWMMTAIARRLDRRRRTRRHQPVSAVVSSLGRHDLRLDGAPLRVLFVPPGSAGLPLFIGLCGDAAGIELSAVVPRAWAGVDGAGLDPWLDGLVAAFAGGAS